jgi:microsomal dipeptidase-like Zn-dependent dipeptidase
VSVLRLVTLALLSLALAGCRDIADRLDDSENGVANAPPYAVSTQAAALHPTLLVADMHSDALLSSRDLTAKGDRGSLDIPRLEQGSVSIVTLTQPTDGPYCPKKDRCSPFPNLIGVWSFVSGWPMRTWFDRRERALYFAKRLDALIGRSGGRVVAIRSAEDLRRLLRRDGGSRPIGAVLGLEGVEALGDHADAVATLDSAGFRIVGLMHQTDNAAGGSSQGIDKGGLTPFGHSVVRAVAGQHLILDLAHASPQVIADAVAEYAPRQPLVSHTGVRAVCDNARNLDDDEIRQVVGHGGLIGIGYWTDVLCLDSKATAAQFADAAARSILHVAEVAREVDHDRAFEHVGLGSDFDGWVDEGFDASGLALITDALLRAHVKEDDIRKVMGGNYCLFLLNNLPGGDSTAPSAREDQSLCLRGAQLGAAIPPERVTPR